MDKFKKFIGEDRLSYFSEKGESMSDAQNIKGKCTQIMEIVRGTFEGAGASKEILHFDTKDVVRREPVKLAAEDIKKLAGKDGEVNALNGWYARSIEAKNLLINSIRQAAADKFLESEEKFKEVKFTEVFDLTQPRLGTVNEETIFGTWAANERAELLLQEQKCVALGKLIHKGQKLHQLYTAPMAKTSKVEQLPSGTGHNKAYPVTVEPLYTAKELAPIKKLYMELHDEHRELEKKVNWYKAKMNNQLNDTTADAQKTFAGEITEWQKKVSEFKEKENQFLNEVRSYNAQLSAKCEERRARLVKEAASQKIFIPEVLREVKKYVEEFDIAKL